MIVRYTVTPPPTQLGLRVAPYTTGQLGFIDLESIEAQCAFWNAYGFDYEMTFETEGN